MQELWPQPTPQVDIARRLAEDERPKPAGRPWVTLVMITAIDGAVSIDGLSGGLGSTADQEHFLAARRRASVIVVGARTASMEDYRPTTCPIAVISGSLSLDGSARLFGDPERRPLLYTTAESARTRGAAFHGIAEVIALGDSLEVSPVLADLESRGYASVMLEGGPTVNSLFLEADLVDELLISYSPVVVGGGDGGIGNGPRLVPPRRFAVDRVLLADDIVFVRYLRRR